MNLWQAAIYFVGEAVVNLRRGWRTSVFAVSTIAMSLFVGGTFLLLGGNAGRLVAEWRGEAKTILYLSELVNEDEALRLVDEMVSRPEVESATFVSGDEAAARFREFFPRMVAVLDGAGGVDLPASVEVDLVTDGTAARRQWLDEWSRDPRIESVDDDVEWLARLDRGLSAARSSALVLWLVFAAGTMITIASLVRLSAFAYREEIDVMRLVGATEFLIRGPFYVEGVLQGLLGGGLAVVALFGAHRLVTDRGALALSDALVGGFLPAASCLALIAAGGLAGLVGALLSVPRE